MRSSHIVSRNEAWLTYAFFQSTIAVRFTAPASTWTELRTVFRLRFFYFTAVNPWHIAVRRTSTVAIHTCNSTTVKVRKVPPIVLRTCLMRAGSPDNLQNDCIRLPSISKYRIGKRNHPVRGYGFTVIPVSKGQTILVGRIRCAR